jgi:hypothetical protein
MAEEELQYDVDDVILDRENCVRIVVRTNGRLFHISFRPEKLREPDQSNPSKLELEYLDLVKAVDNFVTKIQTRSLKKVYLENTRLNNAAFPNMTLQFVMGLMCLMILCNLLPYDPSSSSISSRSLRQQPRNPFFQLYAIGSLSPFYHSP